MKALQKEPERKEVDMHSDVDRAGIILQEWQTCVSSADTVSQRRDVINGIFVTLCLAVVTSVIALWSLKAIPLLLIGAVICVAWLCYLWSLKHLNSAKFSVIQALEESLPKQPFADEWRELKEEKRYLKGTTIERILPISFLALYVLLLISILIGG